MRIVVHRPDGNFCQISNEVIRLPIWRKHKAAFHALVELYSYGRHTFHTYSDYCRATGHKPTAFRDYFAVWEQSGVVRRVGQDFELYPFADGSVLEYVEAVEEPKVLAAEVEAMPRTDVRLSKDERVSRIKKAWDDHKPERFALSGRIHDGIKMAIDASMKRVGIESGEYEEFIRPVLAAADSVEKFGPGSGPALVLGNKHDLEDWKFEQIERLYRIGLASQPKPASAAPSSDEACLDYVNKKDQRAGVSAVCRVSVKGLEAALDLIAHVQDERYIPLGYVNRNDLQVSNRKARVQALGIELLPEWLKHEVLLIAEEVGTGKALAWTSSVPVPVV